MNLSLILFVVVDERKVGERQSRSQMRIVFLSLSLLLFSLFHSSNSIFLDENKKARSTLAGIVLVY